MKFAPRFSCLLALLAAAPEVQAQMPWNRRPTPVPEATPEPTVRRAQRVAPRVTPTPNPDEIPVRPAERVYPSLGENPEDPLSRALGGPAATPAPGARRPSPTPVAPDLKRPSEPAAPGGEDESTIRLTPGATGTAATPEMIQLELANNLYARKQYQQAAVEYEKYLGQFPSATERQAALYRLGESYRLTNRLEPATNCYRNLVIESRETGEFAGPAHYRLAVIYYNQRDYRSAVPLFQRSATLAKANDVKLASYYYAALCLENLDRRVETRELYERIAEITGDNPYRDYARVTLARLAFSDGRKNESLRQFEALARDASKESLRLESHLKAGLLAADLGLIDAATRNLQMVIDWPSAEATPTQRADARVGILRILYRAGKFKELLDNYAANNAQLTGEARAEALLLAANSQRQLNDTAQALALYDQLLKEFPRSPQAGEVAYQRVVTLYAANDSRLEKAADAYLATNPEQEKADKVKLIKAEVLFRKEKYLEAAAAYATVTESANIEPKYRAEAAYRIGYCYAQLKQPAGVIEAFSRFLRAYPESSLAAKALAQRGLAYQQMRNFSAALQDFSALLADFPRAKERELALRQKALLQGQTEDTKGMVETFKVLLKDFPNTESSGLANYWIGRSSFEAKNYKDAVPALQAARKDDEYKNRAWLLLILSYFNAEEKEPLEKEVREYLAAKLQPAVPAQVLNYVGSYLFETRAYDRADPFLTAAAESPSNSNADAWLLVARCRLNRKDFPGARGAAEKYLATKPERAAARAQGLLALGESLVGEKNFVEAQKNADAAMALQAEGKLNAEGRLLLGQIALAKGDAAEAAKAFKSVAVLYDDPDLTPRALALVIEAHRKAGNAAEAKKAE
ncbi:MAG: tetratricopeptide repeat protein, partial [Verrucomicrobia bacterium]|nr:tetratricopeptide repeat protein [Verrucomicrobiota bacterium]